MGKDLQYYLSLNYNINIQPISKEDGGGWLASIPLLEGCIADGETPNEALKNLDEAKEEWLQFCIEENVSIPEPKIKSVDYSGKFTLRTGKSVHRKLVETAEREGLSVNSLVNGFISAGLKEQVISDHFSKLMSEKLKPKVKIVFNPRKTSAKPMQLDSIEPWEGFKTQPFHQSRISDVFERGALHD